MKDLSRRNKIYDWSTLPAGGWMTLDVATQSSDTRRRDTQYSGGSPAVIYDLNICH